VGAKLSSFLESLNFVCVAPFYLSVHEFESGLKRGLRSTNMFDSNELMSFGMCCLFFQFKILSNSLYRKVKFPKCFNIKKFYLSKCILSLISIVWCRKPVLFVK
jgi:hypothetical protein